MPRCSVFFAHRRLLRAGIAGLLGLTMAGCAVVEEFHSDGTASRSILLGSPVIWSRPPGSQGEAIKATGLGLSVLNGTGTLGWLDTSIGATEPGCRVVLMGNSDEK